MSLSRLLAARSFLLGWLSGNKTNIRILITFQSVKNDMNASQNILRLKFQFRKQLTRNVFLKFICGTSAAICLSLLGEPTVFAQSPTIDLQIKIDADGDKIEVVREGQSQPVLTQVTRADFRPFLHPIVAPDGKGELTEYSPGHHKHQTGLFWGFTRVNGRDFFHHPEGDYWKRVAATVIKNEGAEVQWQTVYDMLDENGTAIMRESQIWTMREKDGTYELDLQWNGQAKTNITIGKYDYGGLFLRMPWKPGINGEVVNSTRQKNERAEGQRSVWVDVGMQVEGRDDMAHVAIFDHPSNPGFPLPWRVDGQLGVGPVRARLGDWKIANGETATIQHRLIVHTGELNDVAITEKWTDYSGQGNTWSEWWLAQQEGRAAEFLTPSAAVEKMTIQDGFEVNVYAAEPDITQPMAFCWDDRGRMWVAENRDYENRKEGFSNFGDSRILILEDSDRDGVVDSRKVFMEGIPFPSALAVGHGGVFVGAPPNLLFVPDKNGDDKADLENIEVRLTGWGILDRHETVNSFHWGPDGWLYGCQGLFTPSEVGKPLGEGKVYRHKDPFPKDIKFAGESTKMDGGVWRYHPIKDRFEVVAHGFSNPWGIDYDAKGQIFITACVIPHLWHVVPGGVYHRQGGQHLNPYIYNDIKTIADHKHRSAHGGARIYMSDAFPEKYHDRIFMANIHEHAVLTDVLEPKGSGFVGHHGDDFMLANNAQWVGFSMEIGPAGDVFVLDWHDADICGSDVLNKDTGRIFRMTSKDVQPENWEGRYDDLNKFTDQRLAQLQTSPSAWHARRARTILQHRAQLAKKGEPFAAGAVGKFLTALFNDSENQDHRLRAMWTLHQTEMLNETKLLESLGDDDQHVRAWSIQLLCEDKNPSSEALAKFGSLAKSDSSPVVRLYLAAALQRMESAKRWPILAALAQHGEDAEDHNLPKMLWFALEPLVVESPQQAIELALASKIWMLGRHTARRLTDAGKMTELVAAIDQNPGRSYELLAGMRDAMEGRFNEDAPAGWSEVSAKVQSLGGDAAKVALQLSQQFGDLAAAKEMLITLRDASSLLEEKKTAIRALSGQRHPEMPSMLMKLLDDETLRTDVIRAMASFNERQFTQALLKRYPNFNEVEKLDAVQTLSSRSDSGKALTEAIKKGDIPRADIPAYVARVLRRVVGQGFVDVWGPIDGLSVDQEGLFAKYRGLLSGQAIASADELQGREVFKKTCAACHKLYTDGGLIGPDITGANRPSLDYLLGNILTPSAEIQDAYKMQIILTEDGRIYSGIPAEENDRQLRLRVANEDEPITIAQAQIESRQIASVSMMPNGLLSELTDKEVLDLFKYLQSTHPPAEEHE